jgi:hypothetical protein
MWVWLAALILAGCLPGLFPGASPNTDTWTASVDNQTSRTLVVTGEVGGREYPVTTLEPGYSASVKFILHTDDGCSTYDLEAHDRFDGELVATRGPMCTGEIWTIRDGDK